MEDNELIEESLLKENESDKTDEASEKHKERRERRKVIKWYFIGLVFIILMLLQIGKAVYRHNSEYYKPIYNIIDTLNLSKNTSFNVKIDNKEKTIWYVFNNKLRYSGTSVTGLFADYLSENPDSILNQGYKISITFCDYSYGHKYSRYSIRNFYRDELHKDFDTILCYSLEDVIMDIGTNERSSFKYVSFYDADPFGRDCNYDYCFFYFGNLKEADIDVYPEEFDNIYNKIKEINPELILHNTYKKK